MMNLLRRVIPRIALNSTAPKRRDHLRRETAERDAELDDTRRRLEVLEAEVALAHILKRKEPD